MSYLKQVKFGDYDFCWLKFHQFFVFFDKDFLGRIAVLPYYVRRCCLLLTTDSVVCRSVCTSVCHSSEPCKNGWTDRDAVWVEDSGGPTEACITWGLHPNMARGNFWGKGPHRKV